MTEYCRNYKETHVRIQVHQVMAACREGYEAGQIFSLRELIPYGMCLYAFYTIYPYYLTLAHQGWFPWVRRNSGVLVHCPSPEGISMEISRKKGGEPTVVSEVIERKGQCPHGHEVTDKFEIRKNGQAFCLHALWIFAPYVNKFCSGGESPQPTGDDFVLVSCVACPGRVVFKLCREVL